MALSPNRWAYFSRASKLVVQTLPDPVTPNVAKSPSRPSPKTPSTNGSIPVPLKISSCVASSSKTLVNANFSTARFLESLGGWIVMCVDNPFRGGSTVRYRSGGGRRGYKDCCVNCTKGEGGGRRRRYTWKSEVVEGLGGGSILMAGWRWYAALAYSICISLSPQETCE